MRLAIVIWCSRLRPDVVLPEKLSNLHIYSWSDASLSDSLSGDETLSAPDAGEAMIARIREELPGCHLEVFPNVWGDCVVTAGVLDRVREAGLKALPESPEVPGTYVFRPRGENTSLGVCHWGGWWLTFDASERAVVARVRMLSRAVASSLEEDCRLLLETYVGPMLDSVRSGLAPPLPISADGESTNVQHVPELVSVEVTKDSEPVCEKPVLSTDDDPEKVDWSPGQPSEGISGITAENSDKDAEDLGQFPGKEVEVLPGPGSGGAAKLPEKVSGEAVSVPESGSGRATESPEKVSEKAADAPEGVSGQVTESPEEIPGKVADVPEKVSGRATESPEKVSGKVTVASEGDSGQITESPEKVSGKVTEVPEKVSG